MFYFLVNMQTRLPFLSYFSFFILLVSWHRILLYSSIWPWLLCSSGRPQICGDPPASGEQDFKKKSFSKSYVMVTENILCISTLSHWALGIQKHTLLRLLCFSWQCSYLHRFHRNLLLFSVSCNSSNCAIKAISGGSCLIIYSTYSSMTNPLSSLKTQINYYLGKCWQVFLSKLSYICCTLF